jgi:hypothetical protein
LSALPAVLTAAGVVIFGLLNVAYSVFYDRLGVSPEAVGLGYVNTLTRSTSVLAVLAVAAVLAARVYVRRRFARQAQQIESEERTDEIRELQETSDVRRAQRTDSERRAERWHEDSVATYRPWTESDDPELRKAGISTTRSPVAFPKNEDGAQERSASWPSSGRDKRRPTEASLCRCRELPAAIGVSGGRCTAVQASARR